MIETLFPNFDSTTLPMMGVETLKTLYMVVGSTFFSYLFGLPTGLALVLTDRQGMLPVPWFSGILNFVVNVMRSIPFLILFVAITPLTRLIAGKIFGPTAAIVGLVIAAAPFVARMVEQSLQEVDHGIIEAAQSMGASPITILWKVMLPEAKPSLIVGSAIAMTTILGYSAMAGFCGAGGLGDIALRYGYKRYQGDIMLITIVLLVIVVQILQEIGMRLAKSGDKRNIS